MAAYRVGYVGYLREGEEKGGGEHAVGVAVGVDARRSQTLNDGASQFRVCTCMCVCEQRK